MVSLELTLFILIYQYLLQIYTNLNLTRKYRNPTHISLFLSSFPFLVFFYCCHKYYIYLCCKLYNAIFIIIIFVDFLWKGRKQKQYILIEFVLLTLFAISGSLLSLDLDHSLLSFPYCKTPLFPAAFYAANFKQMTVSYVLVPTIQLHTYYVMLLLF